MKEKGFHAVWFFAMLLAATLAAANLCLGPLNQDEGWYLLAARSVSEGRLPYLDFAYTQAPVLPFVYSWFMPVVKLCGVAGGRLVTMLLGLVSAFLCAVAAERMSGRNTEDARLRLTGVAVFLLIAGNVWQSYFTTVVKTYGLCAFFLSAGFLAYTFRRSERFGGMACFWCGLFFALAAGTRFSAGFVLPVTGLALLIESPKEPRFVRKLNWLGFGIGGALGLAAVFGPFFVFAPEQIRFALFGYHAGRDPGGLMSLLVLKAGFISRFVQSAFLLVLLTAGALILRISQRRSLRSFDAWVLWVCGLGLSLVHFVAPFPYDDYQTIAFPLLAMAVVLTVIPLIPERFCLSAGWMLLLFSVAGAFSSPINQDWFVIGRDRIWWRMKEKSDLMRLRDAADYVRANSPEGSVLLTQDAYLAVESGRSVPPGMEMGPFCYYPDLPRDQAEKLNLLNREMMMELLEHSDAPLAAFSGYGLSIACPAIKEIADAEQSTLSDVLNARYEKTVEFPSFGQGYTDLKIYKRTGAE